MSAPHGTYLGGVRDVESLRGRCWCDPDTKCWHFRFTNGKPMRQDGKRQVVWVTGKGLMTITRAAWELAHGSPAPASLITFRKCRSYDCANPAHIGVATRTEHGAMIAAKGQLKGVPRRILANRRNGAKRQVLTPELRQWIVESSQAGEAAAHALGVKRSIVYRIRQRARNVLQLSSSSVFTYAQAANFGGRVAA